MLIEVRVQLNGTLRQDLARVTGAINVARRAMRVPEAMVTFGPVWERNEMGHVCAARYRCSDTHPAGDMRVWELLARQLEFHAQGRKLIDSLASRLLHARTQHPASQWAGAGDKFALNAILSEVGEVWDAMRWETPECVESELLDVLATSVRAYNSEQK